MLIIHSDKEALGAAHNQMGVVLKDMNNYEGVLAHAQVLLSIGGELQHEGYISRAHYLLGSPLFCFSCGYANLLQELYAPKQHLWTKLASITSTPSNYLHPLKKYSRWLV